jgi:hypothetical protein
VAIFRPFDPLLPGRSRERRWKLNLFMRFSEPCKDYRSVPHVRRMS